MGSDHPFDVQVDLLDGAARVAVIGELDLATAPRLGEELLGVERDGARDVTLDMHDATFVDSTGLRIILDAWKRSQQNGHRLLVIGASGSTRRLCHIAGVEFILDDPSATDISDQPRAGIAR
jgi:anti-anti-sigma factor